MDQHTLYNLFIEEWPEERVKKMTLQEYTNLNKSDSFCYWLEARTEDFSEEIHSFRNFIQKFLPFLECEVDQ